MKHDKTFVESPFQEVLRQILRDPIIESARVEHPHAAQVLPYTVPYGIEL